MIIKLSLMIVFGFLLQNISSNEQSYNLYGECFRKQNGGSIKYSFNFPASSEFGIVATKTLKNLIIPERYWDIGESWELRYERFDHLSEALGGNYLIENDMVSYSYEKETKHVLFHLKTNNRDESGETILYATKTFLSQFFTI